MDLVKAKWNEEDKLEFVKYLEILKREEKVEWTKKSVNTDMQVLAIKTPDLVKISKEIKKGNYLSFLDLNINNYYENTVINGKLICGIKDFNLMKKYLDKYAFVADNWATCDLLKFNIKNNEDNFWKLSQDYIKSENQFIRRIGIIILFEFIDNDKYYDKIYEVLDEFSNETAYYVNMANAWLLCELFIKRRKKTIEYIKCNKLNKFTLNKAISKCRDSYRVSKEDKEYLLKFKKTGGTKDERI